MHQQCVPILSPAWLFGMAEGRHIDVHIRREHNQSKLHCNRSCCCDAEPGSGRHIGNALQCGLVRSGQSSSSYHVTPQDNHCHFCSSSCRRLCLLQQVISGTSCVNSRRLHAYRRPATLYCADVSKSRHSRAVSEAIFLCQVVHVYFEMQHKSLYKACHCRCCSILLNVEGINWRLSLCMNHDL